MQSAAIPITIDTSTLEDHLETSIDGRRDENKEGLTPI
jgi:hypothetical protein